MYQATIKISVPLGFGQGLSKRGFRQCFKRFEKELRAGDNPDNDEIIKQGYAEFGLNIDAFCKDPDGYDIPEYDISILRLIEMMKAGILVDIPLIQRIATDKINNSEIEWECVSSATWDTEPVDNESNKLPIFHDAEGRN